MWARLLGSDPTVTLATAEMTISRPKDTEASGKQAAEGKLNFTYYGSAQQQKLIHTSSWDRDGAKPRSGYHAAGRGDKYKAKYKSKSQGKGQSSSTPRKGECFGDFSINSDTMYELGRYMERIL